MSNPAVILIDFLVTTVPKPSAGLGVWWRRR